MFTFFHGEDELGFLAFLFTMSLLSWKVCATEGRYATQPGMIPHELGRTERDRNMNVIEQIPEFNAPNTQPLQKHTNDLNPRWWDRMVARLPKKGILLVSTDLHGNMSDYQMMKELYIAEERMGNDPFLLFCGDMVHGPNPLLNEPGAWPEYLGTEYRDESAALILDYMKFAKKARTTCLMGNHEHAHAGGPRLSKFHEDEGGVLEHQLGDMRQPFRDFIARYPLLAVTHCGLVFTHASPAGTEESLDAFEALTYEPTLPEPSSIFYPPNTVGYLLWARYASDEQAKALLKATAPEGATNHMVLHGHEIVEHGYDVRTPHQICLSTSYGIHNENKYYLRVDLSKQYTCPQDLREGIELKRLYPGM